jgi:bacterioferritin
LTKCNDSLEFLPIALLTPRIVVAILASPGGICAHRLNVTMGPRTDPDVFPRWWNDQRGDAVEHLSVDYRLAVAPSVGKAATTAATGDAIPIDIGPAKSWHGACMPIFHHELNMYFLACRHRIGCTVHGRQGTRTIVVAAAGDASIETRSYVHSTAPSMSLCAAASEAGCGTRREDSALCPADESTTDAGVVTGVSGYSGDMTPTPNTSHEDGIDQERFVQLLNEDLGTEYQSIVQYTNHIATITGPEFLSIIDELKVHVGQELSHAQILATQISFLGGEPSTVVPPIERASDSRVALKEDLELETEQLARYRQRFAQANDLGLADVAEALRPLLEQTQEHVQDLRTALGQ